MMLKYQLLMSKKEGRQNRQNFTGNKQENVCSDSCDDQGVWKRFPFTTLILFFFALLTHWEQTLFDNLSNGNCTLITNDAKSVFPHYPISFNLNNKMINLNGILKRQFG